MSKFLDCFSLDALSIKSSFLPTGGAYTKYSLDIKGDNYCLFCLRLSEVHNLESGRYLYHLDKKSSIKSSAIGYDILIASKDYAPKGFTFQSIEYFELPLGKVAKILDKYVIEKTENEEITNCKIIYKYKDSVFVIKNQSLELLYSYSDIVDKKTNGLQNMLNECNNIFELAKYMETHPQTKDMKSFARASMNYSESKLVEWKYTQEISLISLDKGDKNFYIGCYGFIIPGSGSYGLPIEHIKKYLGDPIVSQYYNFLIQLGLKNKKEL